VIRKLMVVLGAALAMTLFPLAAAHAQSYPPNGTVESSDPTPAPGGTITVTACCYMPGSTVTFSFTAPSELAGAAAGDAVTAVADANGVATAEITLAEDASGTVTIYASGTGTDGNPVTNTTTVTVSADGGGEAAPLPRTGSDNSTPMVAFAIVLLCMGAAGVVVGRRRSTAKATADAK
jgi:LPXTG-motif cell wall-anchored protein